MQKTILLLFTTVLLLMNNILAQEPSETGYVSWSPDGTKLAVGYNSQLTIMDTNSQSILNSFQVVVMAASPVWSPDGNKLAFANGSDVEVWSEPWNAAVSQHLMTYQYYVADPPSTLLSPWPISNIAWNPDGNMIASSVGSEIDIWNVSNGQLILTLPVAPMVWDFVNDITWSSDNRIAVANQTGSTLVLNPQTGKEISIYRSQDYPPLPSARAIDFSPNESQMVVSTGNGFIQIWGDTRTPALTTSSVLTYYGHDGTIINTVDWNPLEQYIASGGRDGKIRVWDSATGTDSYVIDLGANVVVNSVAWSPDGQKLAYTNPNGAVQVVPAPGFEFTPTPAFTSTYTPTKTLTPSHTPTRTLTPSNTPTKTFTPLPPSNTPSHTPTRTPTKTFTPSLTPTPQPALGWITFGSNRFDPNATNTTPDFDLFAANPSTNYLIQLTEGTFNDTDPSWSPDRSKLVFVSDNRTAGASTPTPPPGQYDLYVFNVLTRQVFRLNISGASLSNEIQPAWSPDGSKIAFVSDYAGQNEILVVNVDSNGQTIGLATRLTNHSGNDEAPAWSPASDRLVFASDRDGDYEIFKLNGVDGTGTLTQLTTNTASDRYPSWSPCYSNDLPSCSQDYIGYTSKADGGSDDEVWYMTHVGGSKTKLTNNSNGDRLVDWSPTEKRVIYVSIPAGNRELTVMYVLTPTPVPVILPTQINSAQDDDDPNW